MNNYNCVKFAYDVWSKIIGFNLKDFNLNVETDNSCHLVLRFGNVSAIYFKPNCVCVFHKDRFMSFGYPDRDDTREWSNAVDTISCLVKMFTYKPEDGQ